MFRLTPGGYLAGCLHFLVVLAVGMAWFSPSLCLAQTEYEAREWVDNTGKHRTLAELVEVNADHVVLSKSNGRRARVPLRRLSEADRKYVRQWQQNSTEMQD